jgi:hypothetical protein
MCWKCSRPAVVVFRVMACWEQHEDQWGAERALLVGRPLLLVVSRVA